MIKKWANGVLDRRCRVVGIFVFILLSLYVRESWGGERLVSLKPNITEILFELGFGDQIVGVTTYCDYPQEAKNIERVADYINVDVEKMMVLKPTLIIGAKENSRKKQILFLEEQKLNVHLFPFERLDDMYESIVEISKLLGVEDRGKIMVEKIKTNVGANPVGADPSVRPPSPSILLIVGTKPLVVVGGNNFLDDILQLLGISNVARQSKLSYPTYSTERLIASQPEIIVDLSMGTEEKYRKEALNYYHQFQSIPAVRNKRIYFLDMGDFRASARIVQGVQKLMEVLQ